ncbi:hypothetical protein Vi05172_g1897 [Venturia inaequalis]|nr:hypothetical protein Vi05172_g1897 [Venturia inaequalis]
MMPHPVRNGTLTPTRLLTDPPVEILDQIISCLPHKAAHNLALCSFGLYGNETLWKTILEEPFGITLRNSRHKLHPSNENLQDMIGTRLRLRDLENVKDDCRLMWASFKKFLTKYPHRTLFVKRIALPPSTRILDLNWICVSFPNLESVDTRASPAYRLLPTINASLDTERFWSFVDWNCMLKSTQCRLFNGITHGQHHQYHVPLFQSPCKDCIKQHHYSHSCFEFVEEMFKSLGEKKGVSFVVNVSDDIGALSGLRFKHSFEASSKVHDTGRQIHVVIRGR